MIVIRYEPIKMFLKFHQKGIKKGDLGVWPEVVKLRFWQLQIHFYGLIEFTDQNGCQLRNQRHSLLNITKFCFNHQYLFTTDM